MPTRTALTGVSKLTKKRHLTCIKKFAIHILPVWDQISQIDPEMERVFNGSVRSLGAEKFIEVVTGLFKHNILRIVAESTRNFIVWTIINNQMYVLYDSSKVKMEDNFRNGGKK